MPEPVATQSAAPAPTPAHHARLDAFLSTLERFGIVALTLAPIVAAPFSATPVGAAIVAEQPATQALAQLLAADVATKTTE